MNKIERLSTKAKLKRLNGMDNSIEARQLAKEIADVLDYVDKIDREIYHHLGHNPYSTSEQVLRERVSPSKDPSKRFSQYLKDSKTEIAYLEKIYSEEGFSDKFEEELRYIKVLSDNLYSTGEKAYYKDIRPAKDSHTIEITEIRHKVKNLKQETMQLLSSTVSLIAYIENALNNSAYEKLCNGVNSLCNLMRIVPNLIDNKHNRTYTQ